MVSAVLSCTGRKDWARSRSCSRWRNWRRNFVWAWSRFNGATVGGIYPFNGCVA